MNIKAGRITSTARVKLELEVQVSSTWGSDCSIHQIHEQAEDEARGLIARMVRDSQETRVKVMGTPEISAVIVKKA